MVAWHRDGWEFASKVVDAAWDAVSDLKLNFFSFGGGRCAARIGIHVSRDGIAVQADSGSFLIIDGQLFGALDRLGLEELFLNLSGRFRATVARLSGDFGLVFWDNASGVLRLARDAMGSRPLYLNRRDDCIVASSELRSALSPEVEPRLSLRFIERQLCVSDWFTDGLEDTIFAGITRLEPGTILSRSPSGITSDRYWDPREIDCNRSISFDDAAVELRRLTVQAVSRRYVPGHTAVHMSGGLDCSSLAIIAKCQERPPSNMPTLVSWSPNGDRDAVNSETGRIERLSKKHSLVVRYAQDDEIESAANSWRTGNFDPRYPNAELWIETELARKVGGECGYLLSGWGGDEFASKHGLGVYNEMLASFRFRELFLEMLRADTGFGIGAYVRSIWRFMRLVLPSKSFLNLNGRIESVSRSGRAPSGFLSKAVSDLSSVRDGTIHSYFAGHIVHRVEAWSCQGRLMGIDYRYPFLDRELVEFCLSLPGWYFRRNGQGRSVFRAAMRDLWPGDDVDRTYKSEPVLQGAWIKATRVSPGRTNDFLVRVQNDRQLAQLISIKKLGRLLSQCPEDIRVMNLIARIERLLKLSAVYRIESVLAD